MYTSIVFKLLDNYLLSVLDTIVQFVYYFQLLPLVDSVYNSNNVVDAYQKVADGHLRGKVVINVTDTDNNAQA